MKEFKREEICLAMIPKFVAVGAEKEEGEIPKEIQGLLEEYA